MAPNDNDHRDDEESYNYNSSSDDDEEDDLFDFDCGLPTSYSNINNNRRNEDRRRGAVHSKRVTVNSLKQSLALSLGGPSEQAEQILQLGTDEAAKEYGCK